MKIKNWRKFQQYKDRNPDWIKLHRELLNDPDWFELEGETAKFLVSIWLLASENKEGELPSIRKIAFRLHLSEQFVNSQILKLSHWLEDVCTDPYESVQNDTSYREETYREETERERPVSRPNGRSPKRSELAEDWWPNKKAYAAAQSLGFSEPEIAGEVIKFIGHYCGKGLLLARPNQAFNGWMQRANEFRAARGPPSNHRNPATNTLEAVRERLRDIASGCDSDPGSTVIGFPAITHRRS